MRKISLLLPTLVLVAMILAACGGAGTSTALPTANIPSTTAEATDTNVVGSATATEAPTEATTPSTSETPGIPVTGGANLDRLSKELDFKVMDQSGKQVGKVDDMVLDLSKARILYVIVGTGGFLDIGEKKIPVPWNLIKVGPSGANSSANGQQNAFILQTDTDTFKNAPVIDPKNIPQIGDSPDSWDISFRKYWSGSGAASGNSTPAAAGTATDMTATATSSASGTSTETSTPTESAGTSQGTGNGQGATSIQGIQLASKVIGAKIAVGAQALGTATPEAAGTSTGAATATSGPGGSAATSTPSATGAATATPSASGASSAKTNLNASINDLIVDAASNNLLYIVVKANVSDGDHLILVPLRLFSWDSDNQTFVLNLDAATLQSAPSFKENEFPDMTTPGWSDQFDTFWKSNGSGGTGTAATATP